MFTPCDRLGWRVDQRARRGMTLIELILVMALLTILLTIMTPQLSGFFEGRREQEEARRLLALTRFARSEAISRSTAMEVWINPDSRQYGLRPRYATSQEEHAPREYQLAKGLDLTIDAGQRDQQGEATILFQPDGTIDDESLDEIVIKDSRQKEITLGRSDVGIGYAIR